MSSSQKDSLDTKVETLIKTKKKYEKMKERVDKYFNEQEEKLSDEKKNEFIDKCLETYIEEHGKEVESIKNIKENILTFLSENFFVSLEDDLYKTKYKEIYNIFFTDFGESPDKKNNLENHYYAFDYYPDDESRKYQDIYNNIVVRPDGTPRLPRRDSE
ncbi:14388_t:CDS:2 [Dentiscutata heterogama]|uniref:14388_t:CDS:1 n=1 Tax=Dentiscutata heterogama TaxID=1316150 RepID=A0ACA9JV06_9GLOM|nr:14388_t:CDS:2 [Dentiscutata heterogama]